MQQADRDGPRRTKPLHALDQPDQSPRLRWPKYCGSLRQPLTKVLRPILGNLTVSRGIASLPCRCACMPQRGIQALRYPNTCGVLLYRVVVSIHWQ
jgi:hypothetical protein